MSQQRNDRNPQAARDEERRAQGETDERGEGAEEEERRSRRPLMPQARVIKRRDGVISEPAFQKAPTIPYIDGKLVQELLRKSLEESEE